MNGISVLRRVRMAACGTMLAGLLLPQKRNFESAMERIRLAHERPKPCAMLFDGFA